MREEWWERPVCYLCDYWWAFLIALVLLLTGWFTRGYWIPASMTALPSTLVPRPTATLAHATSTRVATPGTGDVQVTLMWNSANDLDLRMIDPLGETIYYEQNTSSSGGRLDADANADCQELTSQPVENIFWPAGKAPQGVYILSVIFFRQCEAIASTPFVVRVLVDGQVQEFSGIVTVEKETVEVYRFKR